MFGAWRLAGETATPARTSLRGGAADVAIQFHRLTMSRHIDPTLTTLRRDNGGMAEKAIESLQLRLADRSLPSRQKRRLAWCGRRKAA
jgi:DNA-binding LacI/PurR family transcriptional regulator